MKTPKLFIFAIMMSAALTALTNTTASAQTKAERSWMVFTGYQATVFERSPVAPKYSCESSGIYATANFAVPVDLTDGFYVTIAADGKLLIQEKMTVDGDPGELRSIPVDLVPDDDAELGFPDAAMAYSDALLNNLAPGVHKITVAVSVGEGKNEQISTGTFTFTNRSGCAERFARVDRLINGAVTETVETEEETQPAETEEEPSAPPRPQPDKQITSAAQSGNYVEFVNNCDEDRMISYEYPNGTFSTFPIQKNYPRSGAYPVGTKFWNKNNMGGDPFFVLPASEYTNEMDKARAAQSIVICQ